MFQVDEQRLMMRYVRSDCQNPEARQRGATEDPEKKETLKLKVDSISVQHCALKHSTHPHITISLALHVL